MKPVRNPGYLQWIRTLPCSVCRTTRAVEAAHTGPHGLSQKSSDLSAIPLCVRHHRTGNDSYHKLGPRKFAEVHQVNIRAIVARLSSEADSSVCNRGAFVMPGWRLRSYGARATTWSAARVARADSPRYLSSASEGNLSPWLQ